MRAGVDRGRGGGSGTPATGLIRPLGRAQLSREDGAVGALDLLAGAGLPVTEGFVVTREAHRRFLRLSGVAEEIRLLSRGVGEIRGGASRLRRERGARTLDESLNAPIREALIGLGAGRVAVRSWGSSRGGLGTIPAVLSAVRGIWLHQDGLELQIEAAARGEMPTWPVLVQREPRPEYTGWTTTAEPSGRGTWGSRGAALHDVEPAGAARGWQKGIARLVLEAGAALGGSARLEWVLEDGRWYVASANWDTQVGGAEPWQR